jgi:hypothetical protein
MTNEDYAEMMYRDGYQDGKMRLPCKYADEPEYATGYASGEGDR